MKKKNTQCSVKFQGSSQTTFTNGLRLAIQAPFVP